MKNLILLFCSLALSLTQVFANTMAEVKALYTGADVTIPSGWQISGITISDTTFANTDPKNLILQDSTGGMLVRFSSNHSFAVGNKVIVDISGQTLTSYNGLLEILGVPNTNAAKIGTGSITPRLASIREIITNGSLWQSTLVQIPCTVVSGTGGTYSGYKTLTDGTGSMMHYTRTSATFASTAPPTGNVNMVGIVGNFNGLQLSIRSTADVQPNCIPYTPPALVNHSIAEVKALYNGSNATIDPTWTVTGVVISDGAHQNTDDKNLIIQDSTAGILIHFLTSHHFVAGDKVTVLVGGSTVIEYFGWRQVYDVDTSVAYNAGTGTVTPRIAAISEILANSDAWENTLLQIPCALITGGTTTYTGSRTLTDATGTMILYTRAPATFGLTAFPTDTVNLVGILTNFNGEQFQIRDVTDVSPGCIAHTITTGIEELPNDMPTSETKYYDVMGRQITREECTLCIGLTGNKARKIAIVR